MPTAALPKIYRSSSNSSKRTIDLSPGRWRRLRRDDVIRFNPELTPAQLRGKPEVSFMPRINPDRVLGDLCTRYATLAATRPAYTGRPFRPKTSRRAWFAEHTGPGSRPDRRHRQYSGNAQAAGARRCPARTWKARTMRAGSTVRSAASTRSRLRGPSPRTGAAMPASTSWCSATRRATSARSSARSRSPALLKEADIDKAGNRHDGTPMREALAQAGYAGVRACDRAGTLQGVLRGAYRAGRHAEIGGSTSAW